MTNADRIAMRPLVERLRLKADVAEIATRVAADTGISAALILGNGRRAPVARARQRVMFEARQRGLIYPEIGYAIRRDHTTVMAGVRAEQQRQGRPA